MPMPLSSHSLSMNRDRRVRTSEVGGETSGVGPSEGIESSLLLADVGGCTSVGHILSSEWPFRRSKIAFLFRKKAATEKGKVKEAGSVYESELCVIPVVLSRETRQARMCQVSYKPARISAICSSSPWTACRLTLPPPGSALAACTRLASPLFHRPVSSFQQSQCAEMTAVNSAYTVFSGIGVVISLVPLWWHLESWNVGTCMYMIWTALGCLVHFVDSIVWSGNAINWAPVWCDISAFRF